MFISDGIIDARNRDGDGFGRARVEQVVVDNCVANADQIVEAIFQAVAAHAEGVEPFDDQTVVVLKVGKPGAASDKKSAGARNG